MTAGANNLIFNSQVKKLGEISHKIARFIYPNVPLEPFSILSANFFNVMPGFIVNSFIITFRMCDPGPKRLLFVSQCIGAA